MTSKPRTDTYPLATNEPVDAAVTKALGDGYVRPSMRWHYDDLGQPTSLTVVEQAPHFVTTPMADCTAFAVHYGREATNVELERLGSAVAGATGVGVVIRRSVGRSSVVRFTVDTESVLAVSAALIKLDLV